MARLKVHVLLESLSEKELHLLREYLGSPLHGNSTLYVELLNSCLESPEADHVQLWKSLYPERPFKSGYLRRLLAGLTDHILGYLAHLQLDQNQATRQKLVLEAIRERNLDGLATTALNRARKLRQENPFELDYAVQLAENQLLLGGENAGLRFQEVLDLSELRYLHQVLRYGCLALNQDLIRGTGHRIPQVPDLSRMALPHHLRAYWHLFCHLRAPGDPQPLQEARRVLLEEDFAGLPLGELRDLFFLCINLFIQRLNAGQADAEALKTLYTRTLEQGLLLEQGRLLPRHLKNITVLMARLEEFAWAESFIEAYAPGMASNPDGLYTDYNRGVLAFFKGDHDRATGLFQRVRLNPAAHTDVFYGLDARGFLSMCQFEQGDFEAMGQSLNGMQVFLHRTDRLPASRKKGYRQFSNELSRIARALTGHPDRVRDRMAKIRADLLAHPEVAYRKWLLSKTE